MTWWVWCYNSNGAPNIFGPFGSEARSREYADTLDQDADSVNLGTTNRPEAVRRLKARITERSRDVDVGMKRFSYKGVDNV